MKVGDGWSLEGKVALITGASRGLGRSISRGFAAAGADIVVTSRKLEACESLAGEIEGEFGRAAFPYACNVGDWEQVSGFDQSVYLHYIHNCMQRTGSS